MNMQYFICKYSRAKDVRLISQRSAANHRWDFLALVDENINQIWRWTHEW
jgi:hypothetical protein